MTAGQWLEAGIGFVIPTALLLWAVLLVWRWLNPDLRKSAGIVPGIAEFVLICVFVIVIVLAWEVFKTWRRPRGTIPMRASASELPLSSR
jgi:hypothetical protein